MKFFFLDEGRRFSPPSASAGLEGQARSQKIARPEVKKSFTWPAVLHTPRLWRVWDSGRALVFGLGYDEMLQYS